MLEKYQVAAKVSIIVQGLFSVIGILFALIGLFFTLFSVASSIFTSLLIGILLAILLLFILSIFNYKNRKYGVAIILGLPVNISILVILILLFF